MTATEHAIRCHQRAIQRLERLAPLYPTPLGLRERDRRAMIFRHRRILETLNRNETSSPATA